MYKRPKTSYACTKACRQGRGGAGKWNHQFHTKSGVLQGSPLSGALFVTILDPFLKFMQNALDTHGGTVRACADDVAAVVLTGSGLTEVHRVFMQAKEIANLSLNTDKGRIIPIGAKNLPDATNVFKEWCRTNLPEFSSTPVAREGKYLGLLVGPGAGYASWRNATSKLATRAKSIGLARPPAGVAMSLYNCRVVPVVGYIVQFIDPSNELVHREQQGIHHCLGLATNAASWRDLHAFARVTKMFLRSSPITAVAALWRSSISWARCWQSLTETPRTGDLGSLLHLSRIHIRRCRRPTPSTCARSPHP